MNFVRFVVLPIWIFAILVGALVLRMWAVAAIAGILLVYFLVVVRREYGGGGIGEKRWLDHFIDAWREPSGVGLLAAGVVLLVAAVGFGFTIGMAVGVGIWMVLLGLWVAARLRHRTPRGE